MFARKATILFAIALAAAVITPVKADEWNKKTVITLNEPVEVPSCCNADHYVVLQPGKYVFVLVESLSDRHIVRVFAEDQKTVMATILAVPNYRLKPTGDSVFQFWETPAGHPRAMRAWFYPGDNFGQEFAYHKTQSLEIAKVVNAPVPAAVVESEAELKTVPLVQVDETGNEKPIETMVAKNEPPVQPMPASLPSTASDYPLLGLIGLALVSVSACMSRLSKRA